MTTLPTINLSLKLLKRLHGKHKTLSQKTCPDEAVKGLNQGQRNPGIDLQDSLSTHEEYAKSKMCDLFLSSESSHGNKTSEQYLKRKHNTEPSINMQFVIESQHHIDKIVQSLDAIDLAQGDSLHQFNYLRNSFVKRCISIILSDIKLSSKHNVDQMLWKTAFHQVIEQLREKLTFCSEPERGHFKQIIISTLTETVFFYENLISSLERQYEMNLKVMLTNPESAQSLLKTVGKQKKLAVISCQKSLICLGDTMRYIEDIKGTFSYGKARRYYLQARCLEPRNSHPYNQLAILAVRTKRRLDAIYYYIRSLSTTGVPILTARESLTSLFDDARRKLMYVEHEEGKQEGEDKICNSAVTSYIDAGEEWIFKSNVKDVHITQQNSMDKAKSAMFSERATPSEILKKFVLVFLNLHGILFTKIGFAMYDSKQDKALNMLKLLLNHSPTALTSEVILHILAINLFNVHEQRERQASGQQTSFLPQAVELAFSTIAILVGHVTDIVQKYQLILSDSLNPSIMKDLGVVVPAIKLSCDWMYSNQSLWCPSPSNVTNKRDFDIWSNLAKLCDWLCDDSLIFPICVFSSRSPGLSKINLPEDVEFAGFFPVQHFEHEAKFVDYNGCSKELANQCVRLMFIRDFLMFLCGMKDPLLAFKNGRYIVAFESNSSERNDYEMCAEDHVEMDTSSTNSMETFVSQDNKGAAGLKIIHTSLKLAKEMQNKRQLQIQASLVAEECQINTYVQPHFIIPDTNCFVDHIELVKLILLSNKFVLCVPLLVVTELQGLSLESKGVDSYALDVKRNAELAILFLEQQFIKCKKSELLALTNQGSLLDKISFTNETIYMEGKNDDLILECCSKFDLQTRVNNCKTTVLLSEDKNLRVKAMLRKMPTKSIVTFCKMANL